MKAYQIFVNLKSYEVSLSGNHSFISFLSLHNTVGEYKNLNKEQLIYFLMGIMLENEWVAEYNHDGTVLILMQSRLYILEKSGGTFKEDYMKDIGRKTGENATDIFHNAQAELEKSNPYYKPKTLNVRLEGASLFVSKMEKLLSGPQ